MKARKIEKQVKFIIKDRTSNTGSEFINMHGENCHLEENAMRFDSVGEAQTYIEEHGWIDWAYVDEI